MPTKATPTFTLKVFLYEIEPVIWRRFTMPGSASFADLHRAIQQAMGWENKHLHEFRHGKGKRLNDVIAPDDPDVMKGDNFQEESTVSLADFVGRRQVPIRFLYRYDFSEDWIHEIMIEERSNEETDKPVLLDGERACPPEDCGGPTLFMDALNGDLEFLDDRYDPAKFTPSKHKFTKPKGVKG